MKQQYGLPIEIDADEPITLQDKELHILLFNCIRELLFNVVKHAEASRAVVTLRKPGKNLLIDVCDDGKGFQVEATKQRANDETKEDESLQTELGLSTLRHQLSLYGSSMEIDSAPGAGTHIILIIPIQEDGQET